MAQIQDMWRKLNANERMAGTGAIVVIVAWLLGLVSSYGVGAGTLPLIAALVVLVVYYLKYSPTQSMTWPMPVPTIQLIVSVIAALLALLSLLSWLSVAGFLGGLGVFGGFFLGALIAVLATAVGAVMMALGTWREYQAMPKTPPPPPPPPPPSA